MHVFLSYVLSDWRHAVLCTELVLRTGTGALSIQNNIIISGLVAQRRNSFGSNKYLRKPECTVVCIRSFRHLAHTRTHACTHARTHGRTHGRARTHYYYYYYYLIPICFSDHHQTVLGTTWCQSGQSYRGGGGHTHRHLHVLLDGEDLGVAAPDTPLTHPCYALFDLGFRLKKVCICMKCRINHRTAKKGMHMYNV